MQLGHFRHNIWAMREMTLFLKIFHPVSSFFFLLAWAPITFIVGAVPFLNLKRISVSVTRTEVKHNGKNLCPQADLRETQMHKEAFKHWKELQLSLNQVLWGQISQPGGKCVGGWLTGRHEKEEARCVGQSPGFCLMALFLVCPAAQSFSIPASSGLPVRPSLPAEPSDALCWPTHPSASNPWPPREIQTVCL